MRELAGHRTVGGMVRVKCPANLSHTKVVVQPERNARVYKGIAQANVPLGGRVGEIKAAKHPDDLFVRVKAA